MDDRTIPSVVPVGHQTLRVISHDDGMVQLVIQTDDGRSKGGVAVSRDALLGALGVTE